jgi:putative membrane protein
METVGGKDGIRMKGEVDRLLEIPFLGTLAFFSIAVLALILGLALFELVTRYKNWEEIRKGNLAVAMATGGKVFGICNIFRFSIQNNDSIYESLLWAGYGFVLLIAAYFLFEFLTPVFRVDEEIAKNNKAVGFTAMILSISLSYVIGASVT